MFNSDVYYWRIIPTTMFVYRNYLEPGMNNWHFHSQLGRSKVSNYQNPSYERPFRILLRGPLQRILVLIMDHLTDGVTSVIIGNQTSQLKQRVSPSINRGCNFLTEKWLLVANRRLLGRFKTQLLVRNYLIMRTKSKKVR